MSVGFSMEVSLSMLFCLGRPFPYLLKQLQRAEVCHVELVDEVFHALNGRRVRIIGNIIKTKGVDVTVHAPFVDINIASPVSSFRRAVLKRLKRSILFASQLDSNFWVFHPGLQTGISSFYPGLDWKINVNSVCELMETAKQYNVEITIENAPEPFHFLLKSVDDFTRFYDDLGRADGLGLTLDIGHANINGQIYEFLMKFSEKIVHIHVHDNDGTCDSHLGIGYGNIDWIRVVEELKKIGYQGVITIESASKIGESIQTLKKLL